MGAICPLQNINIKPLARAQHLPLSPSLACSTFSQPELILLLSGVLLLSWYFATLGHLVLARPRYQFIYEYPWRKPHLPRKRAKKKKRRARTSTFNDPFPLAASAIFLRPLLPFFWRNFLERTCATLRRHRHSNGHESATGAADLAKRATSLRGQNGGISTTMRAGSSRWHRCAWRLFPPPRRMVKGACLGLCLSGSSLPQPLSPCNGFTLCRSHLSSSDMRSRGGSLGKNILGWLFWILIKFEFLIIHIS